MSDFFEPPPGRKELPQPPRYRMPEWAGPPHGTVPAVVPLELVAARTERVAVCFLRLVAYPTGFELDVVTLAAEEDHTLDPLLFGPHRRTREADGDGLPPELLRLGVQFADGGKATNSGNWGPPLEVPRGPLMRSGGGGGGGGRWQQSLWVWPLPPPGPLTLVCEWPALGIPLTRCEIDAAPLLDAAARAQVIFSDDHLPEAPGGQVNIIR